MPALDAAVFTELIKNLAEQNAKGEVTIKLLKAINSKLARQLELMERDESEAQEEEESDAEEEDEEDDIGLKEVFKSAGKKIKDNVVSKLVPNSAPTTSPKE